MKKNSLNTFLIIAIILAVISLEMFIFNIPKRYIIFVDSYFLILLLFSFFKNNYLKNLYIIKLKYKHFISSYVAIFFILAISIKIFNVHKLGLYILIFYILLLPFFAILCIDFEKFHKKFRKNEN